MQLAWGSTKVLGLSHSPLEMLVRSIHKHLRLAYEQHHIATIAEHKTELAVQYCASCVMRNFAAAPRIRAPMISIAYST